MSSRNELWLSGTKQIPEIKKKRKRNDAAIPLFFVIFVSYSRTPPRNAIPLAYRLPRRCAPRNDTELKRFNLENGRFSFFTVIFCAVSLRIVFQMFRSGNCSVSPQNLPILSLRGGRILRPTRQSLTERFAIPERTMVARNETEP